MSAAALLAELRERGLRIARAGDRIRYHGPSGAMTPDLAAAVRAERGELLALLDRDERATWRARFELLAAERWHVDGNDRDAARRWAFLELLVEWTEAHPDVNALPSAKAEALARSALAELGILPPVEGGSGRCVGSVADLAAWSEIGRRGRPGRTSSRPRSDEREA